MEVKHIRIAATLITLVCLLCSCGQSNNDIKEETNTLLDGETLCNIVKDSRSELDNSYYTVQYGNHDSENIASDLSILDIESANKIESYAISSYGKDEPSAYTVAIICSSDLDTVKQYYRDYADELREALFIDHYDQSVLAEKAKIGTIYDYAILVISDNSNELYDSLENKIIAETTNIDTVDIADEAKDE